MERPARDGAVSHRVIAFEHRHLVGLLVGKPVPLVVGTVGEALSFPDAVVVDPIVGDVRLVGEGGPSAESKGNCSTVSIGLARLIDMNRRDIFASASASV